MNPTMVKKLQKLQKEMQETQERLQMTEFEGRASGVRIVMLGSHQVVEINIDPALLEDKDMLQDAILLAINDAVETVSKKTAEEMNRFTMGMGLGF
ncbi:MAG: YbaB/EbfC family nucleoid-associated protein [Acholeplasmataceae bacterium]|jgi:DNA-binding YbaB/EbfC family protein|nr:YbaB/EbfC family nucleoid-associated protein [Acholeplasmataceae bacterium]